jgi:hypothetical protein
MKDNGDTIAQKLNMRPLQETEEFKVNAAEQKLDPQGNSFTTNLTEYEGEMVDDIKNLPQEAVNQPPAVISMAASENLKDIELAKKNIENIISLGDDSVK